MPIKALLNNQPVMAWDVAGTGDFTCVECAEKMHYRRNFKRSDGVWVTAHFAHNPTPAGSTPRACSSVGQSEEHMNAKQTLCIGAPTYFWWLNGIVGDVEVSLGSRRADVLFTRTDKRRIVFEPQFTKIPRKQIAERTKDYHDLGCDVIWCFPEKRDDLFQWAKQHFYCVGQLSDDGNEVSFWGNLNPDKYPPGLRARFDDETDPDAWKYAPLPVVEKWSAAPNGDYEQTRKCIRCGEEKAWFSSEICHTCETRRILRPHDPEYAKPPRTTMRDSSAENAYKAWMSCGSMGISRWLLDYKERTTGKRFCTVEEMGDWIAKVRGMELERTGANDEFCTGA